jgi:hypothetical protein
MTSTVSDRLHLKRSLAVTGLPDITGTVVTKPRMVRPDAKVVRSVFAALDIDPPKDGEKISLATLNRAMAKSTAAPMDRNQGLVERCGRVLMLSGKEG